MYKRPINLGSTGYQFGECWLLILKILVIDFGVAGEGTFSKIQAGLRAKSKFLKTCGS